MRRMRFISIFLFILAFTMAGGYYWLHPKWKTDKSIDIKVEAKNESHHGSHDHENDSHLKVASADRHKLGGKVETPSKNNHSHHGESNQDDEVTHGANREISSVTPFDDDEDDTPVELVRSPNGIVKKPEPHEKSPDLPTVQYCGSIEFQGDGFQGTHFTSEEWKKILDQFHEAKRLLTAWLSHHKSGIPNKTLDFMKNQIEELKIIRPPLMDESDLNWRGIGVWTRDDQGEELIRMNSGFIKLMNFEPKRSQFEMTRLVAQSWAPCEFARAGLENPWEKQLKCLGVEENSTCGAGSYSEGGWAISSVLAAILSPPACQLPILNQPGKSSCIQK